MIRPHNPGIHGGSGFQGRGGLLRALARIVLLAPNGFRREIRSVPNFRISDSLNGPGELNDRAHRCR